MQSLIKNRIEKTFAKWLLALICAGMVGVAEAADETSDRVAVVNLDMEKSGVYSAEWTLSGNGGYGQMTRQLKTKDAEGNALTSKFLEIHTGNGPGPRDFYAQYALPAAVTGSKDYTLELDWFAAQNCDYNGGSNDVGLYLYAGSDEKVRIVANPVSISGNKANIYFEGDTTKVVGQIDTCSAYGYCWDGNNQDKWYHLVIKANETDGVTIKILKADGTTEALSETKVCEFANLTYFKYDLNKARSNWSIYGGLDNVVATIPASDCYVWTGKANDGNWGTSDNWSKSACPTRATDVAYIPEAATITMTSDNSTGRLILGADVTMKGTVKLDTVYGPGKLTLDGVKCDNGTDAKLYADVCFPNEITGQTSSWSIYGDMSGAGTIDSFSTSSSQPGFKFYGDVSGFTGSYTGGMRNDGNRDGTQFLSTSFDGSNAEWKFGTNNGTYPFQKSDATLKFGSTTIAGSRGEVPFSKTGLTVEIGAKANSTFKCTLSDDSNILRKVGNSTTLELTLTATKGTNDVVAGTLIYTSDSVAPVALVLTNTAATIVAPTSLTLPFIIPDNAIVDSVADAEKQTTTYTLLAPVAPAADIMTKTAVNGTKRTYTFDTTEQLYIFDGENYTEMTGNTYTATKDETLQVATKKTASDGSVVYSALTSYAVTGGTAVQLAKPAIYRAGFTTVAVNASQSDIELTPAPTIIYTVDGEDNTVVAESADAQIHFTIPDVKGTKVTVKLTATGYTDSETVTYTVGGVDTATYQVIPTYTVDYVAIRALNLSTDNPTFDSQHTTVFNRDVCTLNWGTTNLSNGVIYYGYEGVQRWRIGTYMSVNTFYKYNTTNALVITGLKTGQVVEFIANNINALKDNLTVADINDSDHWDRFYTVGADGNALIEMGPGKASDNTIYHYMYGLRVYEVKPVVTFSATNCSITSEDGETTYGSGSTAYISKGDFKFKVKTVTGYVVTSVKEGDTELPAVDGVYTATIASGTNITATASTYADKFAADLAAVEDGGTVTLAGNVTLTEKLIIDNGKTFTIDLNGKTLTGRTNITHGNVTYTNGTVTNSSQPLNVYGSADSTATNYSVVTIDSTCTVTAKENAICMFGEAAAKNGYGAVINVNGTVNCNLEGSTEGVCVFVSGNLGNTGTFDADTMVASNVVNINGTLLSTTDQAIAMNGQATVNVNSGASVTGTTAIGVKRGKLNVTGGEIHATGAKVDPVVANNNGTEQTGAAISITSTYNNSGSLAAVVTGGTITSDKGPAVIVSHSVKSSAKQLFTNGLSLCITGGTLTGASGVDAVYVADKETDDNASYTKKVISGGSFSSEIISDYCVLGYTPVTEKTGDYYTVNPPAAVTVDSGTATTVDKVTTIPSTATEVSVPSEFSENTIVVQPTVKRINYTQNSKPTIQIVIPDKTASTKTYDVTTCYKDTGAAGVATFALDETKVAPTKDGATMAQDTTDASKLKLTPGTVKAGLYYAVGTSTSATDTPTYSVDPVQATTNGGISFKLDLPTGDDTVKYYKIKVSDTASGN